MRSTSRSSTYLANGAVDELVPQETVVARAVELAEYFGSRQGPQSRLSNGRWYFGGLMSLSGGLHVERTEFLIADQSKEAQDLMLDYLAATDATGELPLYNPDMYASARSGPCARSPLGGQGVTIMKAFILDRYGSADRVRAGDMADPELREDDVLVQVHAAGVNLLDSKIRNGEFKRILPYRLPLILGHDVAGAVVRVGSRVRRFKPRDEVYARPADERIGTFAEFIAIKEEDVAIKPKTLTMEEAASIPLVGLTAWQALIERASLKHGQKVLVHAGSGGVGTFAIQLAKHVGATVATTTSTANADLVRSLGADIVIDYKKEDFADVLRDYVSL